MNRPLTTDIHITGAALFLLPVTTRIPLKFGAQVVDEVTVARIAVEVPFHALHSSIFSEPNKIAHPSFDPP